MIDVVCFVGRSNSGKTTLLERLVPELTSRGYRVAGLKHTHHDVGQDRPGSDTYRLREAGASVVGLISDRSQMLTGAWFGDDVLTEAAFMLTESHDVLLAEGFRSSTYPKIEVFRPELGQELLCDPQELTAAVSDGLVPDIECVFTPDDIYAIADFIEGRIQATRPHENDVALLVNGAPVHLNPFLATVMERVVGGVVGALKDVPDDVRDIQLRIHTADVGNKGITS